MTVRYPAFDGTQPCANVATHWFYGHDDEHPTWQTIRMNGSTRMCQGCPFMVPCAEWGIHRERHGVWGGLTPSDRERIRQARRIVVREVNIGEIIGTWKPKEAKA